MKIFIDSAYRLSKKEKIDIERDMVASEATEDPVRMNSESWKQLALHITWQGNMIHELLKSMEEANRKLDELKSIVEKQNEHEEGSMLLETKTASQEQTMYIKDIEAEKTKKVVTKSPAEAMEKSSAITDKSGYKPQKQVKKILDSWTDITDSISDGSYKDKYMIGNYKTLDLGSYGTIEMQIAGFDTDTLAYGKGKAAITWISRDAIKEKLRINPALRMLENGQFQNSTGSIGGWKDSEIKEFLNSKLLNCFPDELRKKVKKVRKYTSATMIHNNIIYQADNDESDDYLWIPSIQEVFGSFIKESSAPYYSVFYAYKSDRIQDSWWWLRSAKSEEDFYGVSRNGNKGHKPSEYPNGIVIGFCT